jgi:hypothetical protein
MSNGAANTVVEYDEGVADPVFTAPVVGLGACSLVSSAVLLPPQLEPTTAAPRRTAPRVAF